MRKVRCLLVPVIVLVLASVSVLGGEPSQEQIQAWMETIHETQYLVRTANTYVACPDKKSRELVLKREAAFKGLRESRAGIIALARDWTVHAKEPPRLAQMQVLVNAVAGMSYAFKSGDILPEKDYHDFLAACIHLPAGFSLRRLIWCTSFDRLAKMEDVWLDWLDAVHPDRLFTKTVGERAPDIALFDDACLALQLTNDPAGVERVVEILRAAPKGTRIAEAGHYLLAMGAEDGFEALMRITDGGLCEHNNWQVALVAGEQQSPRLYEAFQRSRSAGSYAGFYFPVGKRPDLERGLVNVFLQHGNRRALWEKACEENPVNPPWYEDLPRSAVGILDPIQFLLSALDEESKGKTKTELLWIDALGRTDSDVGTVDLIRWALSGDGRGLESYRIPQSAARGLVRRTLGPARERVLREIHRLSTQKRARLVESMLQSVGIVAGPPRVICGVGAGPSPWRKGDDSPNRVRDLLIAHQQSLMQWIGWIDNPSKLASAYAVMTNPGAHRRFLKLLSSANPDAIRLAWQDSIPVPAQVLRKILKTPGLSPDSAMFLRLRLAELGDNSAYQLLNTELMASLESKDQQKRLWYEAILNEMCRRKDSKGLLAAWKAASTGDPRRTVTVSRFPAEGLSQRNWVAAYLLRFDPTAALAHLEDLNLSTTRGRQDALLIAVVAHSPNAEPPLKGIDSGSHTGSGGKAFQRGRASDLRLHVAALKMTGTSWCRDRLLEMKQWPALAELGDRRAAAAVRTPESGMAASQLPWDVFVGGDLRKAIGESAKMMPKRPYPPMYLNLPGTCRMPDRECPVERLRSMEKEFLRTFPTLPATKRLAAVQLLAQDGNLWTDKVFRAILNDPFAPVRLTGILCLSKCPRPSLKGEVAQMEKADPLPWCRRIAHEVAIFHPDPLEPNAGLIFEIPKSN